MALRNRKHEESTQLKGVNQTDEPSDLSLGQFVELQNFVQAEIYSIKKKRGVATLTTATLVLSLATECA